MAVHCRFRPGEHLKIGQLCEQLRASSTPVREALIRLHCEKLVTSTVREGFFARIPNADEFEDLYQLSRTLLLQAMQSSRLNGRGARTGIGQSLDLSPSAPPWAVAEHFTMKLAQRAGSREVARIVSNINDRIRCVRLIASLDPELVQGMVLDRQQIAEAIAVGDTPSARLILETMFDRDLHRVPELTKELLARAHAGSLD
ncbi:DNA-binding GntR family transcriptional regulator [Inquilinus ginsengisoli]